MPGMLLSRLSYYSRLVATIAILLNIITFVSGNCFLPNGTDRNTILWDSHGDDYQPSGFGSPDDHFQMCCATKNRPNVDTPRKDGLCQGDDGQIWRESCTDPTWKSPSCVKLCVAGINEKGEHQGDKDILITQCSDLSYCCGDKNATCCEQGDGIWLRDGEPTIINPNATQATTNAATLASAIPPATVSPIPISSPPTKSTSGLTPSTIAGIAVGTVAGATIVAVGIWFFLHQRRKRRRQDNTSTSDSAPEFMYANQPPTDTKSPAAMSQHPTYGDTKEGMSMHVVSPLDKEGDVRSELYGDNDTGKLTPRAELAGEDRTGYVKKNGSAVELAGSMPDYKEME
ncbi:MAG: hypothetical protein Q9169_006698 [Polycauliona sp. 2 TL-2023]